MVICDKANKLRNCEGCLHSKEHKRDNLCRMETCCYISDFTDDIKVRCIDIEDKNE
jgi:hypothetical protein